MHPPRPVFGVIGGLGPLATARLHLTVVEQAAALGAVADTDYPALLISSAPPAGLDADGEPDPGFTYSVADTALKLVYAGATVLISACNTLDAYRHQIRLPERVPFLSPVTAAAAAVDTATSTVGVLTSAASRRAGLYDRALAGRTVLYANDQTQVQAAIGAGMAGQLTPVQLGPLLADLRDRGATQVVLGCTELAAPPDTPYLVDSVRALAAAIVGWTR